VEEEAENAAEGGQLSADNSNVRDHHLKNGLARGRLLIGYFLEISQDESSGF
jgi:hypothetical protein